MSNKKNIKRVYNAVTLVLLAGAIIYILSRFVHPGDVEYTDDAMVLRNITPVNTRVQGFIKEIRFNEFQYVHRGDTLVIIDNSEYILHLAQAEANVKGQREGSKATAAGISTTYSRVNVASASIEEARVNMINAKKDYNRYVNLLKAEAVTQQQYDDAKTRYETAIARYKASSRQKKTTALIKNEQAGMLGQSMAGVSISEAELNIARLNLSYTVITAASNGYMGHKDIHVGQLVQPGQELAKIVDTEDIWVIANYRETQMKHIIIGDAVTFKADAVSGVTFKGKVQAISFATGSAYSNVPVNNATGNFVKVEQRIPVRIELTKENKATDIKKLLAGLNVETEVHKK